MKDQKHVLSSISGPDDLTQDKNKPEPFKFSLGSHSNCTLIFIAVLCWEMKEKIYILSWMNFKAVFGATQVSKHRGEAFSSKRYLLIEPVVELYLCSRQKLKIREAWNDRRQLSVENIDQFHRLNFSRRRVKVTRFSNLEKRRKYADHFQRFILYCYLSNFVSNVSLILIPIII